MKNVLSRIVRVVRSSPVEHLRKLPPLYRQILVASGPLLLTIGLGMTSGYSAILLPQLSKVNSSIEIDQIEASWIASMAALPMTFGCLIGGLLMEKLGRKTTQLLTAAPCLLGWILIATSTNLTMILIGRFFTGLCGGLLGPSTGVYISETSEPRYRDFLLGAISLAVALGLFLVHLLGTLLNWKMTAVICCVFPVLSVVALSLVPESPAWLAKKNRVEEAEKSFYWCKGESEESKKEVQVMMERRNVKMAFKMTELGEKKFLKPLIIIIVFIVTNQWAGVNALTFYTVSIMQEILNDGLNNYVAMLIVDLIRLVMSILACVIMKNVKRRPLAIISGVGTSTSLFLLSGYTHIVKNYPHNGVSWFSAVPMVALIAYISFISMGFVPLPWAMMGEVFPLSTRNVGSGISSFMAFTAFFMVVKTNPSMVEGFGVDGTFLVYGTVAFCGTFFIWAFLPETKDKTLHEIEDHFEGLKKTQKS